MHVISPSFHPQGDIFRTVPIGLPVRHKHLLVWLPIRCRRGDLPFMRKELNLSTIGTGRVPETREQWTYLTRRHNMPLMPGWRADGSPPDACTERALLKQSMVSG